MSADSGCARGRFRLARWTLTADTGLGLRHFGECQVCWQKSTDTSDPGDAQLWCLRHAGMSGHTLFQMTAFQFFDAGRERHRGLR